MSELDELIARIKARIQAKNAFSGTQVEGKTYGDEKILITARQMKNFRPPEIREMRRLAQSRESIRWSDSRLFYEQAKFMENYTDDKLYEGGAYEIYYPNYQRMSEAQLRGYFTWRTHARKGIFLDAPATYWFVYIYELLHNVGTGTPEQGAVLLDRIWLETKIPSVKARVAEWAMDYCAYYAVHPSVFRCLQERVSREKYMRAISDWNKTADADLYEAMTALSANNTSRSVLVKEHQDQYVRLSCMILRKVAERYEKRTGKNYADGMFGRQNIPYREMFRNAVFFDYLVPRSYTCIVTGMTSYTCKGAVWSWSGPGKLKGNDDIKLILHEADNLLRKHYGYTNLLKESDWSKEKKNIAHKAVDEMFKEIALEERRKVEFDVSLLEGIRNASEEMRDRLIVPGSEEEFREDDLQDKNSEPEITIVLEEPVKETAVDTFSENTGETLLTAEEKELLLGIAEGKITAHGREGMRVTLLCDQINEKMFDIFGDTVIEFDGELPMIVEDYLEDIKEIISEDT